MIDKGQTVAILAIVAILIIVGVLASVSSMRGGVTAKFEKIYVERQNEVVATLIIDFGDDTVWSYPNITTGDATVHGLLRECARIDNFTIETKYDGKLDRFSLVIAGVAHNETNSAYWQYWLNDTRGPSNCDDLPIQNNTIVKWTFTSAVMATVTIDFGNGTVRKYEDIITTDATVYGFLMEASRIGDFVITVSTYGDAVFVSSIAGMENAADYSKGWQYWVNDDYGMVGANQYPVTNGDTILWKYAEYGW